MTQIEVQLGSYQAAVDAALQEIAEARIVERIWNIDHTVWRENPTEISNRLGWLQIPQEMESRVAVINALGDSLLASGYTDVVVLGMGGSSLAPDMFGRIFTQPGHLKISVVDTTDATAILAMKERLNPETTCFIVATKSGGTAETFSAFKYFYNWTMAAVGSDRVAEHFVAITDPNSGLEKTATHLNFRHIYLNNPNIGGRYSALSFFGLVPAACAGVDVALLIERASSAQDDPASTLLGAIIGELAKVGRDKMTLVGSAELVSFHDWIEQLVAESVGKDGKGILPVVGEALSEPARYGNDRLFVALLLKGDESSNSALDALVAAGQPVVRLYLQDLYDIGAQFFLWEMATAIAGQRMDVQPFDQPNVESAKISARAAVAAYYETGQLPQGREDEISAEILPTFLQQTHSGDYISIHAYVQPTDANSAALQTFREKLWAATNLATTVGYGPRFLHSTGQLHKGDAGNGLFIQFLHNGDVDVAIPNEAGEELSEISFDVLKTAQSLGDAQALLDNNRRLLRFHVVGDFPAALELLASAL